MDHKILIEVEEQIARDARLLGFGGHGPLNERVRARPNREHVALPTAGQIAARASTSMSPIASARMATVDLAAIRPPPIYEMGL
jgi:hypothetical protein